MNDGGSWVFEADGNYEPFEELEKYSVARIQDRLTDQMLERYCKALDIDLFNDAFYGRRAAVIDTIQKLPPNAPVMSLGEANRRTLLSRRTK
jgi:hypothetical protein